MNGEKVKVTDLPSFLDALEQLLGYIVNNAEILFIPAFRDQEFLRLTRNAWTEVQATLETERERHTEWNPEALRREGLTGAQLRLKMEMFDRMFAEFPAVQAAVRPSFLMPKRRKWWHFPMRWFDKTLNLANVILKSLAGGVPGLGAVEEFKGLLESAIGMEDLVEAEEGEDPDPR